MALLDLLGRRWALRILWELRDEPLKFRELREACENMSPSVLNSRIAELRDAGVVENTDEGYALTKHGVDLMEAMTPLHFWAVKWGKRTG
jgi:DNA-binding HxlR family transcriptional regulator